MSNQPARSKMLILDNVSSSMLQDARESFIRLAMDPQSDTEIEEWHDFIYLIDSQLLPELHSRVSTYAQDANNGIFKNLIDKYVILNRIFERLEDHYGDELYNLHLDLSEDGSAVEATLTVGRDSFFLLERSDKSNRIISMSDATDLFDDAP